MADTSAEDEYTFNPPKESERRNSTDSPSETDQNEDTDSPDREEDKNNQEDTDKEKPFNEHPRWKERESEWNGKFNEQEKRHQEELTRAIQGIREEFKENKREANSSKIPTWFGGDQEMWDEYRSDLQADLQAAEDRARRGALEEINSKSSVQDKAVKEATDYMNTEVEVISTDKTLNPDGLKVDTNSLVKFTIENELVDTKGRWNYRAAFKLMKASGIIKPKDKVTTSPERKALAEATIDKSNKGEPTLKTYKTSLDFKKPGGRPW